MRSYKTLFIIALDAFLVSMFVYGFHFVFFKEVTAEEARRIVGEYEQLIELETPQGSHISQVRQFLDSHEFKYYDYDNLHVPRSRTWETHFQQLQLDNKEKIVKGWLTSNVRNVAREFLVTWNIQMRFYFDEEDRLIAHTVIMPGEGL